jgi:hypothetical protein
LENGEQEAAVDALFSVDYLRGKHEIMKPVDELMTRINKRIELGRHESLDHLERHVQWVLWAAVLFLIGNVALYLRWQRGGPKPQEGDAAAGASNKACSAPGAKVSPSA